MEAREYKNWKKRIAGSIFAGFVALNSLTALAYPDVYHVESNSNDIAEDSIGGDAYWSGNIINEDYEYSVLDVLYDNEFVDMEGNIYEVDSVSPYVFCIKHDIVSGYYQTHVRDSNGGCTIKTYESTRCTICNTIWVGDLYATYTYVKCPHSTK